MSDELFNIPEQPLSELVQARIRFEVARAEYEQADKAMDEFGDPIPSEVIREFRRATHALAKAEQRELERMRRA